MQEIFAFYLKDSDKRARKLCKRMGENLFSHATGAAKLRIKQTSSLLECLLSPEISENILDIFEKVLLDL